MVKNSLPERWLEYTRVGNPLRGTPFICFKTPLKSNFDNKVEPKDRFSTDDLIKTVPNLGLVIDLTATDRYNDVSNYRKRGIKYKKVICQGQVLPHINAIKGFFNAVDEYVMTTHAAGKLIGVHCTHGVNRTGYLVCRYMIQRLGFSPATAISEFEDARGHGIERKEYTDHLKTNMGNMPFYVRNAGLTKFLKMNFGPKHTDTGIPTLSSRKDGPVEVLSPPRNEFFPANRGPEMHREQFPPEKQNYQQWQPDAPNQFPEGDLRDRLSSNARISSSNFFNKDSSNEIGRQPPFQKSFYPRLNTGNQYPAGPDRPSTTQMGHLEGGLGPHQTLLPRPGPGLRDDPQQIFHKGSPWSITETDRKRKSTYHKLGADYQINTQNKKMKLGIGQGEEEEDDEEDGEEDEEREEDGEEEEREEVGEEKEEGVQEDEEKEEDDDEEEDGEQEEDGEEEVEEDGDGEVDEEQEEGGEEEEEEEQEERKENLDLLLYS